MTYRLIQLAAGAYDLERDGRVIASVVRHPSGERWTLELLDERLPHPPPFAAAEQQFESLSTVAKRLDVSDLTQHPQRRPRARFS